MDTKQIFKEIKHVKPTLPVNDYGLWESVLICLNTAQFLLGLKLFGCFIKISEALSLDGGKNSRAIDWKGFKFMSKHYNSLNKS